MSTVTQAFPSDEPDTSALPMDALALFWRDCDALGAACDVLDRDAEVALARRARGGNAAAREALVTHNVRLAYTFAAKSAHQYELPLMDALQEALMGLMRAARTYDERHGWTFATYAGLAMKRGMARAGVDQRAGKLRTPAYALTIARRHFRENGEPLRSDRRVLSLDTPMKGEGVDPLDADDYYAVIPAPEPTPEPNHAALLASLAAYLEPRQALVIALRFGLGPDSDESESLQDIGDRLKLSRERVRQIQVKALAKLREAAPTLWPEHAHRLIVRVPRARVIVRTSAQSRKAG